MTIAAGELGSRLRHSLADLAARSKGRLFRKYAALLVALVGSALVVSAAIESYYSYHENREALVAVQREKAIGAATVIEQFVKEIEGQVGWTTHAGFLAGQSGADQRRFDFLRLLRQAPAITEVTFIDASGREQLRVSRLSMDVVGSGTDRSAEPQFQEARARRRHVSPVYFRKESEPYLTLAISGSGRNAGVTVAEVNLKFIWDVISRLKVGKAGAAYVIDSRGLLIAHPDIGLVLRKSDLSGLAHVAAARASSTRAGSGAVFSSIARDPTGREVLTAFAPVETLGWNVFVDLPVSEAFEPLYASLLRGGIILLAGLGLAGLAGLWLAQRMVVPINALAAGAARIGTGDLNHRIEVRTGDEVEALAGSFNAMGARLKQYYAGLEQTVADRTAELTQSLEYQTATSEVLGVISRSPNDLQPVLDTIVQTAARLCAAEYSFIAKASDGKCHLVAANRMEAQHIQYLSKHPVTIDRSSVTGRVALERSAIHVPDVLADPEFKHLQWQMVGKQRTVLGVPLLREGSLVGVIVLARTEVAPFTERQIELVTTFADQAVIAINNVGLFEEVQARTAEVTESLEYQTATSDVLNVISRSPSNFQPVLDAIAETAQRLCQSGQVFIMRLEGGVYHLAAVKDAAPEQVKFLKDNPFAPDRGSVTGRVALDRCTVHVADVEADPEYTKNVSGHRGFRTTLGVPLLRDEVVIGVIVLTRSIVQPFTERQIELVTTFADQAVIAINNVGLFEEVQARTKELSESLQQQTATADVLKAISRSAFDLQPVLETLVESATRLSNGDIAWLFQREGDSLQWVASYGHNAELRARIKAYLTPLKVPADRGNITGRTFMEGKIVHVADVLADPEYTWTGAQEVGGYRAALGVPLLRNDRVVGVIFVGRSEPRAFTTAQVELVATFADQAVIAIENARLFEAEQTRTKELTESLEYQTATSDVLGVISRSPSEVQPVLDAIVRTATDLCQADYAFVWQIEGDAFRLVAFNRIEAAFAKFASETPPRVDRGTVTGRVVLERRTIHITDVLADADYGYVEGQKIADFRSVLGVPLLRDAVPIGVIVLFRTTVSPFSEKQIELVTTFADQAVIAIENARLFEEVQARTREVTEALEYQTATSEVLGVISRSPSQVQPVLDTIVTTSGRLCDADYAFVLMRQNDGKYHIAAVHPIDTQYMKFLQDNPISLGRGTTTGRTALDRRTVHIPDVTADPEYTWSEWTELSGARTFLGVPLLRDGDPIGVIALSRATAGAFTERQIELVTTFADQAVIAIENARLFEEVQARTREVQESLEYQTATSEVLGVISRSPNELQPVLDAITTTALDLCQAQYALALKLEPDGLYHLAAHANAESINLDWLKAHPVAKGDGSAVGIVAVEKQTVHLPDALADPRFTDLDRQRQSKARTMLSVPLMRGGEVIGVLFLARTEVKPFAERQIDLVTTFADQAVIAINNVGLFEEVQARTKELQQSLEQQTATSEILSVISSSPGRLDPVFETILTNARELCAAEFGHLLLFDGTAWRAAALHNVPPAYADYWNKAPVVAGPDALITRIASTGQPYQLSDASLGPAYLARTPLAVATVELAGARTLFGVPLLKEGRVIGAIVLYRKEVRPFDGKQIALLSSFADQAVIAIENARLFEAEQQRTKELANSVGELKALSEVGRAVSSTLDLEKVLETVVHRARDLAAADASAIFRFRESDQTFRLWHAAGLDPALEEQVRGLRLKARETGMGTSIRTREALQFENLDAGPDNPLRRLAISAGFQSVLFVPLVRGARAFGVLVLQRRRQGLFEPSTISLLQTFASQSTLAIQNARLFREIAQKSAELEAASRHKSQFLANMSHELRTPLNAILGYTELLADGIYGELPAKSATVLERVQSNGRHLLGLINDVLDLSKIEAGQMSLGIEDYAMGSLVQTVIAATEPLAKTKGLTLAASVQDAMPIGRGDSRRLSQVLLNLVGNAIKFTDAGEVRIKASFAEGRFSVQVSDTGPGIAEADRVKIFEEFQQVDNSSTRKKGGTGLGLAISKRIVELHGGEITVQSQLGTGSTFEFIIPAQAKPAAEAA